ncbi:MAG TPA: TMEM165/GDT1 family protein [Candidatus Angelobacter sp.]
MENGFGAIAVVAFWTVLIAELVGDKTLYVMATLALRCRLHTLFGAFALASAAKMGITVVLGSAIMVFQSPWTGVVSAAAFFISAILVWVEDPEDVAKSELQQRGSRGALAWFGFFFLAEWGDPGQIAAAALVVKSHLVLGTWLGATAAVLLKGAVAVTLGLKLRERLPERTLRVLATVSCGTLGVLAVIHVLLPR